jgi:hypothetical protein
LDEFDTEYDVDARCCYPEDVYEIAEKVYEDVQNCGVQTFPYSDIEYITAQDLYDRLQPIMDGTAPYDKNTIKDIFLCINSVLAVSVN